MTKVLLLGDQSDHKDVKKIRKLIRLFLVWVAVILCLLLRIISQPDGYVSPDSHAYLHKAKHISQHQVGKVTFGGEGSYQLKVASANWPIGYSLMINIVSRVTGSSLLWASKWVNFIFLSFIFVILYQWHKANAWFVALAFFSFTSFEIFSHTWSEGPFLFLILLLIHFILKDVNSDPPPWRWIPLSLCLVGLFLFRYAGLIYVMMMGFLIVSYAWKKKMTSLKQYLLAIIVAAIPIGAYMLYNHSVSGSFFGAHRVEVSALGLNDIFTTYINAITFARIYVESSDVIYYVLFGLQLVLIIALVLVLRNVSRQKMPGLAKLLLNTAFFYLLAMTLLKWVMMANDFDYRTMAPFSILLFLGVLTAIPTGDQPKIQWLRRGCIGFAILSFVINLPNRYILEWITSLVQ